MLYVSALPTLCLRFMPLLPWDTAYSGNPNL